MCGAAFACSQTEGELTLETCLCLYFAREPASLERCVCAHVQLSKVLPLACVHTLGNLLTNVSLGAVAVSFTHTIKVGSRPHSLAGREPKQQSHMTL